MKKLLLLIATVGLMVSGLAFAGGPDMQEAPPPPPPQVNMGFYAGLHTGVAFLNVPGVDTGFSIGGQVGYWFTRNIRAEAAFSYLYHGFGSGHVNSYLFMANALYDFHVTPIIDPFVGFGIGFDHVSTSAFGFSGSLGAAFAYQAIAGVAFQIMHNATLGVRYRFVDSSGLHYNILETVFNYHFGNL